MVQPEAEVASQTLEQSIDVVKIIDENRPQGRWDPDLEQLVATGFGAYVDFGMVIPVEVICPLE